MFREAKYETRQTSRRMRCCGFALSTRRLRRRDASAAGGACPAGGFAPAGLRGGRNFVNPANEMWPAFRGLPKAPGGSAMSGRRACAVCFPEFSMSQLDAVLKRIDSDLDASLDRLFALLRIQSDLDRSGLQGFLPRRRRLCRRRSEQHRLCRRGAADAGPSDRDRQVRQRQNRATASRMSCSTATTTCSRSIR